MTRRSGSERGFDYLIEYIGEELDFESGFYNDA